MPERPLRVGLSGTGFGVRAHLPALRAHPAFELVAVASPSSALRVASERGIPHAFASCIEMVAAIDLDAVVVASPPFAHRDDVGAALSRRLHVLCEKPFALSVAEAEELVRTADDAGTVCGLVHEFRFIPQRAAIRELVANGHLGEIREIEITHLSRFLATDRQRPRGWWFDRRRGGGIAGALLSHLIDAATWTVGRAPRAYCGRVRTAVVERTDSSGRFRSEADDGAFALVDYGGGTIARLTADGTCAVESFTFAVHGSARTAVASGTTPFDLRLFTVDDDETAELECTPPPYRRFAAVDPHVPYVMELYDHFAAAIAGRPHALPTFREALETQRVLEAIGYSTDNTSSATSS